VVARMHKHQFSNSDTTSIHVHLWNLFQIALNHQCSLLLSRKQKLEKAKGEHLYERVCQVFHLVHNEFPFQQD
jgi:hypothetical protein